QALRIRWGSPSHFYSDGLGLEVILLDEVLNEEKFVREGIVALEVALHLQTKLEAIDFLLAGIRGQNRSTDVADAGVPQRHASRVGVYENAICGHDAGFELASILQICLEVGEPLRVAQKVLDNGLRLVAVRVVRHDVELRRRFQLSANSM